MADEQSVPNGAFHDLRSAPPVSEQPWIAICEWRLVRAGDYLRLIGAVAAAERVLTHRVTSAIAQLDFQMRQAHTSSGRVYEIVGPPASEADLIALLDARLAEAGLMEAVDISAIVWSRMRQQVH